MYNDLSTSWSCCWFWRLFCTLCPIQRNYSLLQPSCIFTNRQIAFYAACVCKHRKCQPFVSPDAHNLWPFEFARLQAMWPLCCNCPHSLAVDSQWRRSVRARLYHHGPRWRTLCETQKAISATATSTVAAIWCVGDDGVLRAQRAGNSQRRAQWRLESRDQLNTENYLFECVCSRAKSIVHLAKCGFN